MDVASALKTLLLIPKVEATWLLAGAIIEEDTGQIKVNDDTITVTAHLRL
jgi:hypothetical protein